MSIRNIKKYTLTQSELYTFARIAWNNCLGFLSDFSNYKPKYTEDFINGKLAEVDAAESMPDDGVRTAMHEALRVELIEKNAICLRNYLFIEGYIRDAFSKDLFKVEREKAGRSNYRAALIKDWENTVIMNGKMAVYITANKTILQANDIMPPDFGTTTDADSLAFDTVYEAFTSARQTSLATGQKIIANNVIYSNVVEMMKDGKRIFAGEHEKLGQFEIKRLRSIISSAGGSSLKVTAVDPSNKPLSGVVIKLTGANGTTFNGQSDENGDLILDSIAVGNYTGSAEKEGYLSINFEKEVTTGTDARLTVVLKIAA